MKIACYVSEGRIEEIDLGPIAYVIDGNYGIICHAPVVRNEPDGFHSVPIVSIHKGQQEIAQVFYHIYAEAPVLRVIGARTLTKKSLEVVYMVMSNWEFYSKQECAYFPVGKRSKI